MSKEPLAGNYCGVVPPKLFDSNSSFGVLRTNPKISGNVKITLDSEGGVWLNSMDANPILSDQRFKKYRVTGQNSYGKDIQKFFSGDKTSRESLNNNAIFEVGKFTDGENKPVENFSAQYDFFYGAGATTLVDRNYPENFRYFQPLWLRDELPEFFVVFKIPEPLSYPYSTNQTQILDGIQYKVIQDVSSAEVFQIAYGKDSFGNDIIYSAGQFFTGNTVYSTYTILSGTGKVALMDEILFQPEVDDVKSYFNSKILPYATVISTFDLRDNTTIGKYIRSVSNDPGFNQSPIQFSYQSNTYTYFNGIDVQTGAMTRKGELLYDFLISNQSTPQIDFENYVTSGFSRNGIIAPNILNLEFLFDDSDSDLYTINRYFGCYISKNCLGSFKLNGDFFFQFKGTTGNNNLPKPPLNNVGFYNSTANNFQSSTTGVRLFYQDAYGWIPGSYDVNVSDPQKLFYIKDKFDQFYSLKRFENYNSSSETWEDNAPIYAQFGPYLNGTFSTGGTMGSNYSGNLVIPNRSVNLLNFTGPGEKIGGFSGILPKTKGHANINIQFLVSYDSSSPVIFKIFWSGGTQGNLNQKFDLVQSGKLGGTILGWKAGSSYSSGNSHYFNLAQGQTNEIASSFSACVKRISSVVWDSANVEDSSIIRARNPGPNSNTEFKIAVFSDYESFSSNYTGIWSNSDSYSAGQIVSFYDTYYVALNPIVAPSFGNFNPSPISNSDWSEYQTFTPSGILKMGDLDASTLTGNLNFRGGSDFLKSRVIFSINEKDKIVPGTWIEVESGRGVTGSVSMISAVTRYVDDPIRTSVNQASPGVINFRGFNEFLIAHLSDENAVISLGTNGNFNLFEIVSLESGVFSFFDLKDFDFDFLASTYGITPTPEFRRYFQLVPNQAGQIKPNVKYLVRQGSITYNSTVYQTGQAFIGTFASDLFIDSGFSSIGISAIVFPAIFSQVGWVDQSYAYSVSQISAEQNLNSFIGFYGIQSIIDTNPTPNTLNKQEVFNYGKLETEYQYLQENFTVARANVSRIVPFINKWGYLGGTDVRGNVYRLNSSPAFAPTNFSPSFQNDTPNPSYFTHEWFLLEGVPREFPAGKILEQNSYLPGKIDLDQIRDANPASSLYSYSFFTVEPLDYPAPYADPTNTTKEFFTPFFHNPTTGFYETVFRGVKISLKRKSNIPNPTSDLDKYVLNYRGFEGYNFSSILRVIPEDSSTIQSPVSYEVIENTQQKIVLFVTTVVMKDYRALPLGNTGGTGDPYLDYLLMYSLVDKKQDAGIGLTGASGPTGSLLYKIADTKLSAALDMSITSNSSVTTLTNPGSVYLIPNPNYDTDLREEINLFYPVGSTGSVGGTGAGSFVVPSQSYLYPWPAGRSQNLVNFGAIDPPDYEFTIPFAFSSPVTIPVGPRSAYAGYPVFQVEGGGNYFNFVMKRISLSQIFERVNGESPYIKYTTYEWDPATSTTIVTANSFQISLSQPTALFKPNGIYAETSYSGPQTLGGSKPTGFQIVNGGNKYASDILRYGGPYEPLFRKIFRFKGDKNDTLTRNPAADLSFRNCTFAPEQSNFGKILNLGYSKVSLGANILQESQNLPQGPKYPFIGQTPIFYKDFSVFLSTWDPGYYNLYTSATEETPVAGTRSMKELKSFLGSKMMQTPYTVTIYTFITLEISRETGTTIVPNINEAANAAIPLIQNINPSNSNTGIGQLGTYLSNVDLKILDENIFPQVEVFWQKNSITNTVYGTIRLDRILRRYLLNSGISTVFVNNMISDFGVGNPNNINDDIDTYIEENITPIYEGISFDLFVKKTGQDLTSTEILVRGDLINPDRIRYAYYAQPNFRLTKTTDLIYSFEYPLTVGQNYSLTFSFRIQKI